MTPCIRNPRASFSSLLWEMSSSFRVVFSLRDLLNTMASFLENPFQATSSFLRPIFFYFINNKIKLLHKELLRPVPIDSRLVHHSYRAHLPVDSLQLTWNLFLGDDSNSDQEFLVYRYWLKCENNNTVTQNAFKNQKGYTDIRCDITLLFLTLKPSHNILVSILNVFFIMTPKDSLNFAS